ncbi:hypothetical protein L1887_56962 [Cichorium endivia]|nr:hypothetical protein L1887_56962 [Cichorium endivia]
MSPVITSKATRQGASNRQADRTGYLAPRYAGMRLSRGRDLRGSCRPRQMWEGTDELTANVRPTRQVGVTGPMVGRLRAAEGIAEVVPRGGAAWPNNRSEMFFLILPQAVRARGNFRVFDDRVPDEKHEIRAERHSTLSLRSGGRARFARFACSSAPKVDFERLRALPLSGAEEKGNSSFHRLVRPGWLECGCECDSVCAQRLRCHRPWTCRW